AGRIGGADQLPMSLPFLCQMETTEGRGKAPRSGQVLVGSSTVPSSPGCCGAMNTVLLSSVMNGPQHSASTGTVAKVFSSPLYLPCIGTACSASWMPSSPGWPSVEIHRLPCLSKVRLSGAEIGATFDLSYPAK